MYLVTSFRIFHFNHISYIHNHFPLILVNIGTYFFLADSKLSYCLSLSNYSLLFWMCYFPHHFYISMYLCYIMFQINCSFVKNEIFKENSQFYRLNSFTLQSACCRFLNFIFLSSFFFFSFPGF